MIEDNFWQVRSKKYNNLKWVNDDLYLNQIIATCKPKSTDLVLDVGTGSGKVAKGLKPFVNHVIGMDISPDMMSYNNWEGMSKVCGDILNPIFQYSTFDLITARMVFHHVPGVIYGLINCFNLLKENGRLVIAESIPPSDDYEVVKWWSYVRSFKEERHTFSAKMLKSYLELVGFKNIKFQYYYQKNEMSSTKEWLANSKLPQDMQMKIFDLHKNAPSIVRKAHKMKITPDDVFCQHRHLIIYGEK